MIRWVVDASLKARIPVIVLAAAVIFFAVREIRDTPVDTLPEFGPTTVQIQTEALGLSAPEVEQLITIPMEQDLLNGVAWVRFINSKSVSGLSSIELTFEPGTDPFKARLAVQERVAQAKVALPGVSSPPQILQPLSSTNRVMIVGMSSNDLTPIEMSVLARWTIRPRLMGVPGVANVSIWGQRERQLQVLVDPEDLRDKDVSLGQVIETTANALWVSPLTYVEASTPGTSGFIDTPNQRLGIQHILPITSPADLGKVDLEGSNLHLGDVANVVEDHQPLIGDAVLGDRPGLMLVIEKFPEANTLDTTRGVEDAIDKLRPGLSGLEFDENVFRPAASIQSGVDDVQLAAVIGLVAAALILALLFLQWRTAIIALVSIPLSLLAAGFILSLRGETINVIVVTGLAAAVGLVIDDLVTDTRNVMRRLNERRGDAAVSVQSVILESVIEGRGPALFAALITIAAAAPVFFLDGLAGEFLPPMALSYVLAVLTSLVVALTVAPALSAILFSIAPPRDVEMTAARWIEGRYADGLRRLLTLPRAVAIAAFALAVAGMLAVIPALHRPSLVPPLQEDNLLIQLETAPGTSLAEMDRIASAVGQDLRTVHGVRDVGGHVGRAILSDQIVGANSGELWVSLDDSADHETAIAAIRQTLHGYPGLHATVSSYSDSKINDANKGPDQDVTVRVYGEDLGLLRTKAQEIKSAIAGIDGVSNARVDLPTEEPNVEIKVNLEAAQRYGIEPGGVRRTAATLLQGIEAGSFFEHQKVFQVIVRGTPETRDSIASIRELPLETANGGSVPLGEVADVRIAPNPSVIERESVSRRLDIGADIRGRSRSAVVADIRAALKNIEFPYEYHAVVLNSEEENPWSLILLIGGFAAVAIFLLLQVAIGSWRGAALFFALLPVTLVGGILAAFVDGGDLSIGSYAGFLTLLALSARGGLALVQRYDRLQREGRQPFGAPLIVAGATERIVPVLMTACATAAALLALLLVGHVFAYEVIRPMAVVVLGGLFSSAAFVLFLLPGAWLAFGPKAEPETERAIGGAAAAQFGASVGGS